MHGLAMFIYFATGIVSFYWSMSVIIENLGFFAGTIAVFIFPATITFTPFYVGFSTGDWTLLAITYGGGILAFIIMIMARDDSRDETRVALVSSTAYQASRTNNLPSTDPAITVDGQYAVTLASNGGTNKATQAIDRPEPIDEDRVYRQIAEELETGAADKGMWTRLFAECGGDEKQIKVMYIKQRAERLIAAETSKIEEGRCRRESKTQRFLKPVGVKLCPYCREEVLPTSDYCARCGKYFSAT